MNYMMLLQDAPPNTSGYMIAGYVVFVVVMAIYLVSFMARRRNLEQDLSTLRTIEDENKDKLSKPAKRPRSPRKAASARTSPGRRSTPKKRPTRRGR
jgi:hypothetical protein